VQTTLDVVHSLPSQDDAVRYGADDRHAIESHYANYFGCWSQVIHERQSRKVHLDVYIHGASPDRDYVTLTTCGMSAVGLPWKTGAECHHPPGLEQHECRYAAELVTYVPAEWDFSSPAGIYLMRSFFEAARYPHESGKLVAKHHTLCTYDPATNLADPLFPGSLLTHWFFRSLINEPESVDHLRLPSGRTINFVWVYPITRHECHYRDDAGPIELEALLATCAEFPIRTERACLIAPESREQRRARNRESRRRMRSTPQTPWTAIACDVCEAAGKRGDFHA
jgi:hypothetical protein